MQEELATCAIIGGRDYDYLESKIKNRSKYNHYSVKLIHNERKVSSIRKENREPSSNYSLPPNLSYPLSSNHSIFSTLIYQLNALFKMGRKMRDKATVKFPDSLKEKKRPNYTDGEQALFRCENFWLEMETVSYKCLIMSIITSTPHLEYEACFEFHRYAASILRVWVQLSIGKVVVIP